MKTGQKNSGTFKKGHTAWNKGKKGIYSEETLKKLSKSKKGKKLSEEHKRSLSKAQKKLYADGYVNPNKGKKPNQETLKKLSKSLKGRKVWNKGKTNIYSEETRKKMSEASKGRIPWNKGKKGVYSEETLKKLSKSLKGRKVWNKGKTNIYSEETRKKMSEASKGRTASEETKRKMSIALKGLKRKPFSKEHRKKLAKAQIGKKHTEEQKRKISLGNKGKKISEETRKKQGISQRKRQKLFKKLRPKDYEKYIEKVRENRLHQIFPKKDTKLEKFLQSLLKDLGVKFITHKPILGQPDIFIEPNICIFADGDYWHANPMMFKPNDTIVGKLLAKEKWANDEKITKSLKTKGFVVLRFWEHDLEMKTEECIQKILKTIKA